MREVISHPTVFTDRTSIVQLLEDEPLEILRPFLEDLIKESEKNKQRAAAELLAGIISGALALYDF